MATIPELYYLVQNQSGVTKFFGYLPPTGMTLTAGQKAKVWIHEIMQHPVKRASFEADITAGTIAILNSAADVTVDTVSGLVRKIVSTSSTPATATPSWGEESSEA